MAGAGAEGGPQACGRPEAAITKTKTRKRADRFVWKSTDVEITSEGDLRAAARKLDAAAGVPAPHQQSAQS